MTEEHSQALTIAPPTQIITPTSTSQAVDLVSQALLDDLQRNYLQTREKLEAFSYYGRNKMEQLEQALQRQNEQYEHLQQDHATALHTLKRVRAERDAARRDLSRLTRKTVALQKQVQRLEAAARNASSAACGGVSEYFCSWDQLAVPWSKGYPDDNDHDDEDDYDEEDTADTESTE